MAGIESSRTSGESMARSVVEQGPQLLPFTDSRVQVFLARLAFPMEAKPMLGWLSETDSLSSRYRAYIEEHPDGLIDITDQEALAALLAEVQKHDPEPTVH